MSVNVPTATSLLSRLQPEKFAALCAAFDTQPTGAALATEIERHMQRWQRIVDCAGAEFAAMLGEELTVPVSARSEPATPDPNPPAPKATAPHAAGNWIRESYRDDPGFALNDAQRALACLHDILGNFTPAQHDLSGIMPDNMTGFLRLVIAQFPEA